MNKKELYETATKLEELLVKYSFTEPQAIDVLKSVKDILKNAINGEINEPLPGGWFHIYLEPGYELAKISELTQIAAEFSILLEGWSSLEEFSKKMDKIELIAEKEERELRNAEKNKNS